MKITLISLILSATPLFAAAPSYPLNYDEEVFNDISIQNRVLLKIKGKAVTVMDIVRKLDFLFYRQYPEHVDSIVARYQFYSLAWRNALEAVIDDYLISADAEEKKVSVQDGEIREELEKVFGPNVVLSLDKMGLALPEAIELMRTELIVQRMTSAMVRSKAFSEVHPQLIRERYEQMVRENPPQSIWHYQVLTLKGTEAPASAQEAARLFHDEKFPLSLIAPQLMQAGAEANLSELYVRTTPELSASHKEILSTLKSEAISPPIQRKESYQIFYLKLYEEAKPKTLKEMEEEIHALLTQEASIRFNKAYREKLRKQYGLTETYLKERLPEEFEPFLLR
jgi:hypothetical protein